MQVIKHNPPELFPQYRCYTHAVEIRGDARLLMISGLNGEANVRMRVKYLGNHEVSSTVICCQLLDPKWKLEIEAVAAGEPGESRD